MGKTEQYKKAVRELNPDIKNLIEATEIKYGLPKNLLLRLAFQESSFDPTAHNKGSNAAGMFQIVKRWHPEVSNPYDVTESADYAAKYLVELHLQTGDWLMALAAYNWGIGNLNKKGFENAPKETRNYVAQIGQDVFA